MKARKHNNVSLLNLSAVATIVTKIKTTCFLVCVNNFIVVLYAIYNYFQTLSCENNGMTIFGELKFTHKYAARGSCISKRLQRKAEDMGHTFPR
jgi:hypothetical protein